MKKKISLASFLAVLVACLLCFTMAGCGGSSDDGKKDDTGSGTAYTVTFDLNYSGSTAETATVEAGGTVAVPSDPTGNGNSIFSGWYADAACTTEFDFSGAIYADTTVYAGWTDVPDGYCAIICMYNYEGAGTYKVELAEIGVAYPSLSTPTRSGYRFKGWYNDPECTDAFSTRGRASGNVTVYALWYYGYKFEAEYTDLMDEYDEMREFHGFSVNGDPIGVSSTASNGYYIGDMFISGCYIYFDVISDRDVDDADLVLSLAMAFGWEIGGTVTITSSDYRITVNDAVQSFDDFTFDVSGLGSSDITLFKEFEISTISLKAGTNTIRLEVTNETHGQGGTQRAVAPLVDYMLIYTSATLSWDPITSNVAGH